MQTTVDLPSTVNATDRADMEHRLDKAVAVAKARAFHEGRQEVLVTRQDYGTFKTNAGWPPVPMYSAWHRYWSRH